MGSTGISGVAAPLAKRAARRRWPSGGARASSLSAMWAVIAVMLIASAREVTAEDGVGSGQVSSVDSFVCG